MNWEDIGVTLKHVVVRKDPGIFIHVLCNRKFKFYPRYIKRRKLRHHCLDCITALKKLIRTGHSVNSEIESKK